MDSDDMMILDSLLGNDSMIIEEEVIQQKPTFNFICTEDMDTYYPDVIARRRYGGYKPPKARKVIFLNPFEKKKVIDPPYMKELQNSMERMRIRENDVKDRKIKYIKKKYPNE